MGRGWTLRVPTTNGYPPSFGKRARLYPPDISVMTTGYPGNRISTGCPQIFRRLFVLFQRQSVDRVETNSYYCSIPKRVRKYKELRVLNSILRPSDLAFYCSVQNPCVQACHRSGCAKTVFK